MRKGESSMTQSESSLNLLRHESQELHRNVAGLFSDGRANAKFDFDKLQSKANKLGTSLKLSAETEQGAIKAMMHRAGAKLESARSGATESVHASTQVVDEAMDHAKAAMLDDMAAATRSLSEAVAARRTGRLTSQTATSKVSS
ncbi:hypothetical protein G3T14_23280 [Methylobacterium sp. BTF04]|uniref:hypothetical protein n=1 Tax=Methylobacterium sp. BTF04 TaxID=2708300 RepID=UPI0013D5ED5E|nr:hypothetical protein [Methylobacterium sp. BTF04]NEU14971.1 hypothetical protein [Methylobacterium sp. BTF04]